MHDTFYLTVAAIVLVIEVAGLLYVGFIIAIYSSEVSGRLQQILNELAKIEDRLVSVQVRLDQVRRQDRSEPRIPL